MRGMRAADILTPDQVRTVQSKSTLKGVLLIVHAWAVIFGAMALFAYWPNPATFILAVAVIAGRQLGLSILMHEGAHGLIAQDAGMNLKLSQWLCAYPVLLDTVAYRKYHLKHHARTQQPDDPDLVLSAPFPITPKSFRRKVIRDLTGQTGLQQRLAQFRSALGDPALPWRERLARFRAQLGAQLFANLVLFSGLAAAGYWYLYPLLWLAAPGHGLPAGPAHPEHRRARHRARRQGPVPQCPHDTCGPHRPPVPGALLGQLPRRASSAHVGALLQPRARCTAT